MHSRYLFIILILAFGSIYCNKNPASPSIECNYSKPEDTYLYPIRPGTSEWRNLPAEDHLKACQIPDSIVRNISTEGLIQSWIDFPLNIEIIDASTLQKGIEFFMRNFSGLKVLIGRKNAGEKLTERYKAMNPACVIKFKDDVSKGGYTLIFTYIEMLLGQDTILGHLTIYQKKQLISIALNKYKIKKEYIQQYGFFGEENSLFVCARIMKFSNYQPFVKEISNFPAIQQLLNTGTFPLTINNNSKEVKVILFHSNDFIK